MITVNSYPAAVILCVITMLCWGSWANTQKLAGRHWRFQLFYWDYSIGVLLLALGLAFTLGSSGTVGRSFLEDFSQADAKWLGSAALGGVIFNLSNILLVAAIEVAGLAVAFPVGVGLALVLGVITTYTATRAGNVIMLSSGVAAIFAAILLDAMAYRSFAAARGKFATRGIVLSVVAGLLMGWFYSWVAQSIGDISLLTGQLTPGKLSPYTAIVCFSIGLFLSNFLWNSLAMRFPANGSRVSYRDYFVKGSTWQHAVGVLGGLIWNLGMALNVIASTRAGPALSYGLGQGATLIGAIWGVFIWREFKGASRVTMYFLAAMFFFYFLGLAILIASKA